LVRRLGEPGPSLGSLPDPVVAVQVATEEGTWVDVAGRRVDGTPPAGTAARPLGPDVRLLTRQGSAGASAVVGRLGAADLVALSNARLAALTRAHQLEVRESQRRIVSVADHERLRIERDLHDGAQQRLVAAKLHLRLAESEMPPSASPSVAAAEEQVQVALERLRTLAHGVFPRLLEAEGLTAALDDLAARAPVPVHLDVAALGPVEQRLPLEVSTALYAVAAASVPLVGTMGAAEGLAVRACVSAASVSLQVAAPVGARATDSADLQEVADRVGAVGGRLTLTGALPGWTLTAEVPCESS
jgi:signal transduction histidine kinase